MLTLSKSSLWYRRSCAACKLKLSSTLVNGQINKCKRATEANKNNSGSPKTVLFSAMTAEKKEKRLVFTSGSHRKWTMQLLLWLRRWGVFISRAFEKYYWNLILKKWKKIILNLPASFLNFPRGDGFFFYCPARGDSRLVFHFIDRRLQPITTSHNSIKTLTRKTRTASGLFFFPCNRHVNTILSRFA